MKQEYIFMYLYLHGCLYIYLFVKLKYLIMKVVLEPEVIIMQAFYS